MSQSINLYIDESIVRPGVVLIALVSVDNGAYEQFIAEKIASRKKTGAYEVYDAKLHYTEDVKSIKSDMAGWVLRTAPMSVYFLIQKLDTSLDEHAAKQKVYSDIFPQVLLRRIIEKYRKSSGGEAAIDVAFENLTDKLKADKEFFQDCVDSLGYKKVSVRVIGKDNLLTILPDYMAGILGTCIGEKPQENGKQGTGVANARLVQDKIGLIAVCESDGTCRYFERGEEVYGFIAQGYRTDI